MCHVGIASKRGGLEALEGKVEPIGVGMVGGKGLEPPTS
jgi:hypothetical protein